MSSDKVQDYSHFKDTDGMTAHLPRLLFTTAWSCDSPHIASGARNIRQCLQTVRTQLTSIPLQSTQPSQLAVLHVQLQKRVWSKFHMLLVWWAATYKQPCQQYLQVLHAHLWGDKNQLCGWEPILSRNGAESTLEMCTSDFSKNWAFCRDTVNYFAPWGSWGGTEVALYSSANKHDHLQLQDSFQNSFTEKLSIEAAPWFWDSLWLTCGTAQQRLAVCTHLWWSAPPPPATCGRKKEAWYW